MRLLDYKNRSLVIRKLLFLIIQWVFIHEMRGAVPSSGSQSASIIDQQDTIIFDLANGISGPGFLEFPLYFVSDDTINAVDFAFRFDQTSYAYDTTYTNLPNLSYSEFQNPADSTVRFTSFSIQVLNNFDHVAWVRFLTNQPAILASDFFNVEAYLNGDVCSYKFTDGNTLSINDPNDGALLVYPNPTDVMVFLSVPEGGSFRIYDSKGRLIYKSESYASPASVEVDTRQYPAGAYIIALSSKSGLITYRQIISH